MSRGRVSTAANVTGIIEEEEDFSDLTEFAVPLNHIQKIRRWHFNSLLTSDEEAKAFLKASLLAEYLQTGASSTDAAAAAAPRVNKFEEIPSDFLRGHAVTMNGKVFYFPAAGTSSEDEAKDGSGVVEMVEGSVEGLPKSYFVNRVAVSDAADAIAERVLSSKALSQFQGWDINLVRSGEILRTQLPPAAATVDGSTKAPPPSNSASPSTKGAKKGTSASSSGVDKSIIAFVSSHKTSQNDYFDFVVYSDSKVANYNTKNAIPGLLHSGDIGSLLHYVEMKHSCLDLDTERQYALAVVGYQAKKLRHFESQLPAFCIPSYSDQVLHIVPCPLDQASIGDNTMACLLSMRRVSAEVLEWVVAARPVATTDVNTEDMNSITKECYEALVSEAGQTRRYASRFNTTSFSYEEEETEDAPAPAKTKAQSEMSHKTIPSVAVVLPESVSKEEEVQNAMDNEDIFKHLSETTKAELKRGNDETSFHCLVAAERGVGRVQYPTPQSLSEGKGYLTAEFGLELTVPHPRGQESTHSTEKIDEEEMALVCTEGSAVGGYSHTDSTLPALNGPLVGAPVLALGASYRGSSLVPQATYWQTLCHHSLLRVIHVSSSRQMTETLVGAAQYLINGVFVVHCPQDMYAEMALEAQLGPMGVVTSTTSDDEKDGKDKRKAQQKKKLGTGSVESLLNSLNITPVTVMAGPRSLVVAQLSNGRRYYYRGAPPAGLVKEQQEEGNWRFGDDVTEWCSDIALYQYCDQLVVKKKEKKTTGSEDPSSENGTEEGRGGSLPPALYYRGSRMVFYNGVEYTRPLDAVNKILAIESSSALGAQRAAITELIHQLPVVLDSSELQKVMGPLRKFAIHLADEETKEVSALAERLRIETRSSSAGGPTAPGPFTHEDNAKDEEVKDKMLQAGITLAERKKKANADLQWFVSLVNNCVSVKGTSSRAGDMNRLRRKEAIASNVDAAKKTTADELINLLDAECDLHCGIQLVHIDPKAMASVLRCVSRDNLRRQLYGKPELKCAQVKMQFLTASAVTMGAMQQLQSKTATCLHPPSPAELPEGAENAPEPDAQVSLALQGVDAAPVLPFPLFRRFTSLSDPSTVQWTEECNEPEVAKVRILLRGTIASSKLAKDVAKEAAASGGNEIVPQAKDMSTAMLLLLIQTLEEVVGVGWSVKQYRLQWDSKKARTCRGILGLILTTMASGAQPQSYAFQLVGANPNFIVPGPETLWQYAAVARLFHTSSWKLDKLVTNTQQFVIRFIRKYFCDKVLEPVRKAAATLRTAKAKFDKDRVNAELSFLHIMTEVLFTMSQLPFDEVFSPEHKALMCAQAKSRMPHDIASSTRTKAERKASSTRQGSVGKKGEHDGGYEIVSKFFLRLPDFEETNKGKEQLKASFQYVLQVALDIVAKRSACFSEEKRKLLIATIEHHGLAAAKKELVERVKTVKAKATASSSAAEASTLRMQNGEAIKQGDLSRMKGDAELHREAWHLVDQSGSSSSSSTVNPHLLCDEEIDVEVAAILGLELEQLPGGHAGIGVVSEKNKALFLQKQKKQREIARKALRSSSAAAGGGGTTKEDKETDDRYLFLKNSFANDLAQAQPLLLKPIVKMIDDLPTLQFVDLFMGSVTSQNTVEVDLSKASRQFSIELETLMAVALSGEDALTTTGFDTTSTATGGTTDMVSTSLPTIPALREVVYQLLRHYKDPIIGETNAFAALKKFSTVSPTESEMEATTTTTTTGGSS